MRNLFHLLVKFFGFSGDAREAPVDLGRLQLAIGREKELLDLFFRLGDEKLTVMEQACRAGRYEEWCRAAHYLKGSAANLGMHRLTRLCQEAETMDRLRLNAGLHMLQQIRASLRDIKDYLGHT